MNFQCHYHKYKYNWLKAILSHSIFFMRKVLKTLQALLSVLRTGNTTFAISLTLSVFKLWTITITIITLKWHLAGGLQTAWAGNTEPFSRNHASPSDAPSWQAPPRTLDGTDLMAEATEETTSLLCFQKLGSSFGCWCHFLPLWFSPVLSVTWEEVCASHEYLPVDKAQSIHIYLFQSRFTVPQVHGSFKHFWGHVADCTDLGKQQIKASHQQLISKVYLVFNALFCLVFSTVKENAVRSKSMSSASRFLPVSS